MNASISMDLPSYVPLLVALARVQHSAAARPRRLAAWHIELVDEILVSR